jgi:hypothetical protein
VVATEPVLTNGARQSVSIEAARNLATTTKSRVQQLGVTPRYLLNLMPWIGVEAGAFRVNQRKVLIPEAVRLRIGTLDGSMALDPMELGRIPFLRDLDEPTLEAMATRMTVETFDPGQTVPADRFSIVASGQLEARATGMHGENLRLGSMTSGDYFGEQALVGQNVTTPALAAATPVSLLRLSSADVDYLQKQGSDFNDRIAFRLTERTASRANEWGEAPIDLESGHWGEPELPRTLVDYQEFPKEYSLEAIQTILRVHTRVTDIYNSPIDQLREQMGLTISAMRERQEWEVVNHPTVGLLAQAAPSMRLRTRVGPPTPDDMDDLISRVWKKPCYFLAHPRAIAAFGRECTSRGVPPATTNMFGQAMLTWRGLPIVPSDKLEVNGRSRTDQAAGMTSILLMRTGETDGGVIGLHQAGLPDEIEGVPSMSVKFMGINTKAVAAYLMSLYFSVAVMTDDALGVLEGVEVGRYHDYE